MTETRQQCSDKSGPFIHTVIFNTPAKLGGYANPSKGQLRTVNVDDTFHVEVQPEKIHIKPLLRPQLI